MCKVNIELAVIALKWFATERYFVGKTLKVSKIWKVFCDIFYNVKSMIWIFHILEITMYIFHYAERMA